MGISRYAAFALAEPKRKYSTDFKVLVFMEVLSGFESGSKVCHECGIRS